MRRATLAVITCWASAVAAMGASPPPPPKKAVTPQKKASPPPATKSAAKAPAKPGAKPVTTQRYYGRQPVRRTYPARPVQQAAPTSDRFREIQDALAAKGYLKTPSSGVWDKASMDAMQRFQQDQKLDASGRLTARSIVALGLGPKTASSPASGETSPLQ